MPAADPPLAGVQVLVTRPASQARRLVALIQESGGRAVSFPVLEIIPIDPDPRELDALSQSDMVIFVSANAVSHGYPILRTLTDTGRQILAIGPATRRALQEAGCADVCQPNEAGSTEALLAQPVLRDVADRRICIVRGRGGRELLGQSLASRGARVSYLECYRREPPAHPETAVLVEALDDPGALVISVTSVSGLSNLLQIAPAAHRQQLLAAPLVVIGGRQKAAAIERGWRGPVLEAGAGDGQIVDTIIEWRAGAGNPV